MHILQVFITITLLLSSVSCQEKKQNKIIQVQYDALNQRIHHLDTELKKANKKVNEAARCQLSEKRLQSKIKFLEEKIDQLDDKKRAQKIEELKATFGIKKNQKLYATLETSMGRFHFELFWQKAPYTVANFIQLAEGKKEWTHPVTGQKITQPLYNGLLFYRTVPQFMVQTGSPDNSATGGPGFTFADEFHPDLRHDRPGILSMANSGKDTNGSQFFITLSAQPHLDDKHSIFGALLSGKSEKNELKRLHAMANAEKKRHSKTRPLKDIVLQKIRIGRGKLIP